MGTEDKLREVLAGKFGNVAEFPFAEGVLDSLSAVELGLEIERVFQVSIENISLADMQSVHSLAARIDALSQVNTAGLPKSCASQWGAENVKNE